MAHLTSTFLRGFGVVLPVALTVWFVVWLAVAMETLLRDVFLLILPQSYYLPGLGLVFGLALVYAVGVLVQVFMVRRIWEALRAMLERIPLVKTVYTAINDFFEFFSSGPGDGASTVVSVDVGGGASVIGFITDHSPTAIDAAGPDSNRVAVYLPLSYQIGGCTVLIPRERITPLAIGVEEAMRLVLTAAIQKKRGRS